MNLPPGTAGLIRTDTQAYPYTAQQWSQDFGCMVPKDISAGTLIGWPIAFVMETTPPANDSATQKLEHTAVDNAGTYEQSWSVVALDAGELDIVERTTDDQAVKADAGILQLLRARDGAIDTYVQNNFPSLTAPERDDISRLARATAAMAKRLGLV